MPTYISHFPSRDPNAPRCLTYVKNWTPAEAAALRGTLKPPWAFEHPTSLLKFLLHDSQHPADTVYWADPTHGCGLRVLGPLWRRLGMEERLSVHPTYPTPCGTAEELKVKL